MTGTSCYRFEHNLKIPTHLNRDSIYILNDLAEEGIFVTPFVRKAAALITSANLAEAHVPRSVLAKQNSKVIGRELFVHQ